jgi:hypothetical protein
LSPGLRFIIRGDFPLLSWHPSSAPVPGGSHGATAITTSFRFTHLLLQEYLASKEVVHRLRGVDLDGDGVDDNSEARVAISHDRAPGHLVPLQFACSLREMVAPDGVYLLAVGTV